MPSVELMLFALAFTYRHVRSGVIPIHVGGLLPLIPVLNSEDNGTVQYKFKNLNPQTFYQFFM